MLSDLKLALRQLARNPGNTTVAVITLVICLGANVAIFAVVLFQSQIANLKSKIA